MYRFLRLSSLVALAACIPAGALARVSDGARFMATLECRTARYPIGIALTGHDVRGKKNLGEVAKINRIRYMPRSRTVGFLYSTGEGLTFVTDRPTADLQLVDLEVMNQIVQAMGVVHENAFDPRDNGFVYYKVRWNPRVAKAMFLTIAPCPKTPVGDR